MRALVLVNLGKRLFLNSTVVRPNLFRRPLFVQTTTKSIEDLPKHKIIKMPALSPTMTQGNIGVWKKKVGDPVTAGDVLVEIETDKAQMEFECQEEGYLAKILIPEGTKEALVGKPLAIFVNKKEDVEKFKEFNLEEGDSKIDQEKPPVTSQKEHHPTPTPDKTEKSFPSDERKMTENGNFGDRMFASPAAKVIAKNMGVDLEKISGTGPRGRVLKSDVLEAAKGGASVSTIGKETRSQSEAAYIDIPLSNMRKVIAQRLTDSKQTIPHYYLTVDIEMDNLIMIRERANQKGIGKYKLSINDFIIKAAARAMKDVPEVNSAWHGTFVRQFQHSNISVAVATESGLITPIINQADLKGLVKISTEMRDLASKAKENKLRPEQFQGGSFTISNLGMFGIKHFTAIINPPQSCILAVGGSVRKFVPDENGNPIVRNVMSVTMSCDHRVVDGAIGAHWLQYFKKYMEDPVTMLL